MLYIDKESPGAVFKIEPKVFNNLRKNGIKTCLEEIELDLSFNAILKKISRLKSSGWNFYTIIFTFNKEILINSIEKQDEIYIEDLFYPIIESNLIPLEIAMEVIAKNEEHVKIIVEDFLTFSYKEYKEEDINNKEFKLYLGQKFREYRKNTLLNV